MSGSLKVKTFLREKILNKLR